MQTFEYMTDHAWPAEIAQAANKWARLGWRLLQVIPGSEKEWSTLVLERAIPVLK